MNVFSVFQHSAYLELALIELEQMGIRKENILAVPLDKRSSDTSDLRRIHRGTKSKVDLVFIFGTIFMLLGAIYGFRLPPGPILWALFGLVFGAGFGLIIEFHVSRKLKFNEQESKIDVVVVVHCSDDSQAEWVERVLWQHYAIGVAKTKTHEQKVV